MIIDLIEALYRLLWGDLFTLPVAGGIGISFMVVLLFAAGIGFTLRTRLLPVRLFRDMIGAVCEKKQAAGGLSSFQTLVISTATRVGMGNLVGVVAAVSAGGAGAVFWMWVTALLGASTSFVESTLAQKYRVPDPLYGGWRGGPAYYLHVLAERKRGKKLKRSVCAVLFAVSGLICWCGISQVISNSVSSAFENAFRVPPLATTVVLTLLAALIVLRKNATVKSLDFIVPVMAVCYFVITVGIVVLNIRQLPAVLARIFAEAFGLRQVAAGGFGAVLMNGVKRGLFSNEAGSGSAPCAAAAAECDDPVKMGLVQALGVLIDTVVICSCTAFLMLLVPQDITAGLTGMGLSQDCYAVPSGQLWHRVHCGDLSTVQLLHLSGGAVLRPGQCGLPVRRQLVEPDCLQAAGAGHAADRRHTGLHRGVGSGRCGHRTDDHLQYAGARSPFRRGADRPERLRNAQKNKIRSQKRAAAQGSVQQPVL